MARLPTTSAHNTQHSAPPSRRGFTLTEILVVIVLIVLILGMAVPVLRVMTGSKSQAGAMNQIAAMLGRVRNDAIGQQQNRGCVFYVDTTTGRTAMAEVEPVQQNVSSWQADPNNSLYYPAYPQGTYASTVTYSGAAATPVYHYYVAVRAVPATLTANANGTALQPGSTSGYYWMPVQPYDGSAASYSASDNTSATAAFNTVFPNMYDIIPGQDAELLPSGIGIQLTCDDNRSQGAAAKAGTAPNGDRYLQIGMVMFDAYGRMTYQPWVIYRNGPIGVAAGYSQQVYNVAQNNKSSDLPGTSTAAVPDDPLYSAFGLVMYDRDAWLSQNFPSDWIISGPNSQSSYGTAGSTGTEYADEAWVDANSTPLLVDRYTGTLLRSE